MKSKVFTAYKNLKWGVYMPSELGLKLPGLLFIYVGRCHGRKRAYPAFSSREMAHAHSSTICFYDGRYVLKSEGVPTELLHEYAHILSDEPRHGPVWRQRMIELEQKPKRMIWFEYKDR